MASRYFFALYPPPGVRAGIAELAQRMAGSERVVARDRLHMTLVFLGERSSEKVQAVKRAAGRLESRSFTLYLDTLGHFPRGGVLWLGIRKPPPVLMKLSEGLREYSSRALCKPGCCEDEVLSRAKPFVPHVTLARRAPEPTSLECQPVEWWVDRVVLMRSTQKAGQHVYTTLEEWPLR